MPKVVDNYVLERKIGSGQFGDVFKGYNKQNREDIAIKAIKRESLKGTLQPTQANSTNCSKTRSKC
jgi:serine/threonine-protein kinase ULK/ATG1